MQGVPFNALDFQRAIDITDETLNLYKHWFALLTRWNSRINLVASSTLRDFWFRHAMDSHQIHACLPPGTKTIIDLGAGAGFPGIALAVMMRDTPGAQITLVESNGKKCNFLRTVIRELSLPAEVIQRRAEDLTHQPYDVVTARAFAPLPRLLSYAHQFWNGTTVGVFPKGESWESEIEDALVAWEFKNKTQPSQTDENARILMVTKLRPKKKQDHGGQSIDQKSA
ncbi:MAG: 16S rRNA (guanine(527)-N(7))-methyltransferase RsmG [Acidimicrobiales bacterium]|nr:16S rRNA (guanine(527)-N(7))-methyltransferase RsmG [Hyphomonadaceae bacterium]RZV37326.1 MAG: 16S rRNA (guanine(527)-N(7))-methyltransferase RsmG [Acidimicrobiales bacterium]